MRAVLQRLPGSWVNDDTMKCDVMFLTEPVDRPTVLKQFNVDPSFEEVVYVRGAILWRADRAKLTRSKVLKVAATPLYKQMTIRNCNTARKLLDLMQEVDTSAGR